MTITLRTDTRGKKAVMGRFGGGFNWAVGFRAGHRTLVINLLVCSIVLTRGEE